MSAPIPVNPEVLRWARVSLGLEIDEVAARIKKGAAVVQAWEAGEAAPTYVQLETLAYAVYKRPLAVFFFPAPPAEESIEESFRTLPETEIRRIPPRLRFLLRRARVLQMNLAELYAGANPAQRNLLADLHFDTSVSAQELASVVRAYLQIDLAQQQEWPDADTALAHWRDSLEEHGIAVFKDSFNPPGPKQGGVADSPFSGFCLYDPDYSLIYVNNNKSKTRQIFTLFHELAHLLMRTGGVDTRQDDYIEYLTGRNKRIEVLCNQFAAEFLVPHEDFEHRSADMAVDEHTIQRLADFYNVSREVILRRFLGQRRASQDDYDRWVAEWAAQAKKESRSGGNHYATKRAYLGERYLELVFSNYYQNRISREQVSEYLGEKPKNLPGMEALLYRRSGEL